MNNFWNNRNPQPGPLFAKKSAAAPSDKSGVVPAPNSNLSKSGTTSSSVRAANPSGIISGSNKTRFDHDIACGVFVGAFEVTGWVASLEVLEITDPVSGRIERIDNWLRANDMLAILTKEYGKARQAASSVVVDMNAPPHQRAQQTKERDEWMRRQVDMREQVVCLLQSRQAYVRAKELEIKVLIPAP